MRWIAFFILVYVVVGVHIALRGFTAWAGAAPNFVLLAAVFVIINAPRDVALVGCLMLGAFQDLFTQGPLGLYAFSYGLVGLALVGTQNTVYRSHPLTHVSLALAGALITGVILLAQGWIHPLLYADGVGRPSLPGLVMGAVCTAAAAPLVVGPLQRLRRVFGFRATKQPLAAGRR